MLLRVGRPLQPVVAGDPSGRPAERVADVVDQLGDCVEGRAMAGSSAWRDSGQVESIDGHPFRDISHTLPDNFIALSGHKSWRHASFRSRKQRNRVLCVG